MRIDINWTPEKVKKTKQIIESWMKKHECYSSEQANQDDECIIYAIELIGDLAGLLVEHDWEDED